MNELVNSKLNSAEQVRYATLMDQAVKARFDLAYSIKCIHDERLYREEYATFEEFCKDKFTIGRDMAYKLIQAQQSRLDIEKNNVYGSIQLPEPSNPTQVRPLSGLDADDRVAVWQEATKETDSPSERQVSEAKARVLNETPKPTAAPAPSCTLDAPLALACAKSMRGIDLCINMDAKPMCANSLIGADSLSHDWKGKVLVYAPRYVNYTQKLLDGISSGEIEQAIMIAPISPMDVFYGKLVEQPFALLSERVKIGNNGLSGSHALFLFNVETKVLNDELISNSLSFGVCQYLSL